MLSTICNRPAMPRITFVDLNGDGKAEAVAIDKNAACYGEPGDWFTVLRREPNRKWHVILRNVGVLVWEPTHTNGWMDARLTGGGQCDRLPPPPRGGLPGGPRRGGARAAPVRG